jgi:hypothetical protein
MQLAGINLGVLVHDPIAQARRNSQESREFGGQNLERASVTKNS